MQELGVERQTRLTYCRGKLELMTPVAEHDRCHKLIESLIMVLVDELNQEVTELAPVLLKDEQLGCATEPDACYYFRDEPEIKHRSELDLNQYPCPDLVVEVSLTKSNLEKLPIYATLGIPEVWRYLTTVGDEVLQGELQIYQLQGETYIQRKNSPTFPFLTGDRVVEFLQQSDSMNLATALRVLRAWAAETLPD